MSALRKAVELQMRLRGLSPKTHQSYIHAMEELARFYGLALETLVCAQVQGLHEDPLLRLALIRQTQDHSAGHTWGTQCPASAIGPSQAPSHHPCPMPRRLPTRKGPIESP
jgi:hypothetical protein